MSSRHVGITVALAMVVASAAAVQAAPTRAPQIKDPAGDSLASRPGMDITSVLYSTVGTGAGRAYVPKRLRVVMTLAGPVEAGPGVTYEVEAATDRCGDVTFTHTPGTPYGSLADVSGWVDWGDCAVPGGSGGLKFIRAMGHGNTIRWEFPLAEVPAPLGTEFYDFRARVDPMNPVMPLPSRATLTDHGRIDAALGSATWVMR